MSLPDDVWVRGNIVEDEPIKEITMDDARDLRKKLQDLRINISQAYLDFAETLWTAYKSKIAGQPLWKSWGYESFEEYANIELGMKRSKAYHFMQIWGELRVRIGLSKKKISALEWSKARELASLARSGIMTMENADEWIDAAENANVIELVETVKTAKQAHRENANSSTPSSTVQAMASNLEKIFRLSVVLMEDQYDNVMKAFELAEKQAQSNKRNHLLDMICLEYISNNVGNSGGNRINTMQRMAALLSRTFNVDTVIIDKNTEDVLVGEHLLK